MHWRKRDFPHILPALFIGVLLIAGCAVIEPAPTGEEPLYPRRLGQVRFTIQVGAFANIDNAVRLTESLQQTGLNAYHFIDVSGLYKVRFGNYIAKETARREAQILQAKGLIAEFYVVSPRPADRVAALGDQIVMTARNYIGIPYKWGGESADEGFDCSGLTMTVYQLNGLDLPRTSRQQWRVGTPVARDDLQKGDLLFFATSGGRRISHVGIYAGEGKFIHAPGRGKSIRLAALSKTYYRKRFMGARRYI